jgi:hypothetical protein
MDKDSICIASYPSVHSKIEKKNETDRYHGTVSEAAPHLFLDAPKQRAFTSHGFNPMTKPAALSE